MEQQICSTQDQMGNPQIAQPMAQQQMMLCPVRFVYDTSVYMPQGEQVQQSPTIIINPQNPPPWARPVQNQVIYVQQIPNNLVPMQQHIDPNMYLQQHFINYPQMVPQQIINQNEQIRVPIQLQNMMATNVVQNIQGTVQMPEERNIVPQMITNYEQIQNPNVQNQINVVQNMNRQVINTVHNPPQVMNQNITPKVEIQKQTVYRNITPQINQHTITRPQIPQMVVNQVQNVPTVQNIQPVSQTFTNIRPNIPIHTHNVNTPQNVRPTFIQSNNIQVRPERPATDVRTNNATTVSYSAVRNGQAYTYRAIQPRPPQYRNLPNLLPVTAPRPNITVNNQHVRPHIQTPTAQYIKTDNNVIFNRKRKSESPDEIQKKIPANTTVYGNITVTTKPPPMAKSVTSEIGVNTSPVHRFENKNFTNQSVLQVQPMDVQHSKEEFKSQIVQQINKVLEPLRDIKTEIPDIKPSDKEKLVRNTVFTQARGRVLNDKQNVPNNINIVDNTNYITADMGTNTSKSSIKQEDVCVQTNMDMIKRENTVMRELNVKTNDIRNPNNSITKVNLPESQQEKVGPTLKINNAMSMPELFTELTTTTNSTIFNTATPTITTAGMSTSNGTVTSMVTTQPNYIGIKINESTAKLNETTPKTNETKNNVPILGTAANSNDSGAKTNDIPVKTDSLSEKVLKNTTKSSASVINKNEITIKTNESTPKINEITNNVNENETKTNELTNKAEAKPKSEEVTMKAELEPKIESENTDNNDNKCSDIENGSIKNRVEYKNLSINDVTGKEIHIVDGNIVKEDKDYVLTHVLDGYVIQESNVPFAVSIIRKPLKEKVLYTNTPVMDQKQEPVELKETAAKDNKKILDISHLHLNEVKPKEMAEDKKNTDSNPFGTLKPSVVKKWTVEELASHLSKHNWTETILLLREHEIDGESLFLASKPQLLTIGVSEEHADAICDFVKS